MQPSAEENDDEILLSFPALAQYVCGILTEVSGRRQAEKLGLLLLLVGGTMNENLQTSADFCQPTITGGCYCCQKSSSFKCLLT